MVKPEKFGHLHLVYHFTIPLKGKQLRKKKINLLALEFFDQSKLPLKVGLSPSKNNYFYLIQC